MRATLALAALALLVLPSVAGDHVYSHRFIVDGRLVGSDGLPLPGRTIQLTSTREDFLEPCREGTQPVTNEAGDFTFCYHHHDLDPQARIVVSYGNASANRSVDIATRRVPVFLHEPNETGVASEGWNTTYRISGRAWKPGPIILENVQVFGEAIIALPVNLTVHFAGGEEQTFRTTTDGYGDYDLLVETQADPSSLSLSIEAKGRAQPVQLDPIFHRAYAPIYVSSGDGQIPTAGNVQPSDGPSSAPGNTTPRVNPVLIVGIAVALVVAIVLSRRKKP